MAADTARQTLVVMVVMLLIYALPVLLPAELSSLVEEVDLALPVTVEQEEAAQAVMV